MELSVISRLDILRSLIDFALNLKGIGALQQFCVLRRISFVHHEVHLNVIKMNNLVVINTWC